MMRIAEMLENGFGVTKNQDEAVRWYKKITKGDYSTISAKAYDKLSEIGSSLPSTDINIIKPLLTRIASAVNNNFSGLMGAEIQPGDDLPSYSIISEISYYKCLVETGFKNAYIKKETVEKIEVEGFRTRSGPLYLYNADIAYSITEDEGVKVYKEWVKLLKAIFPRFENREVETGYHIFSGYAEGGSKLVSISISHSRFADYKPVSISIQESY